MAEIHAIKRVHLCETASGRLVVFRYLWEKDEDPGISVIGGPGLALGQAQLGRQHGGDIRILAQRVAVYDDVEIALKALRIALRKAEDAKIPSPREPMVALTTDDPVLPWLRRWSLTHHGKGWLAVEATYSGGDRGSIQADAFVSIEQAAAWVEAKLAAHAPAA